MTEHPQPSVVVLRVVWVWGPALALMLLIFGLSSLSDLPAPPAGLSDVSAHALVYAGLGATLVRALAGARWRGVSATTAAGAVMLAVLYGVTDELHQSLVPGRVAETRDVLADAVGAGAGVGLVWAWGIVFRRREQMFE